jgi:hypothetical protein
MIIIWVHGKRITDAIKKYGIENFEREILKFFDSRLEMFEYEHLKVDVNILKDPQCYNLIVGGRGSYDKSTTCLSSSVVVSEDGGKTWKLVSTKEYHQNKEKYITYSTNKVNVSVDNGKTWKQISKEEFNNNKEKYLTPGKNKIAVKDKLGKIYYVDKTDERYLSGELVPIWCGKQHREEIKEKIRNTMTPKDSKNSRIWVSKDGQFKYLRKELLEEYLNNGWVKGRIKK